MAYHSWQNKAPSKEFDEGHAATFGEKADPYCDGCGRLPHYCECAPGTVDQRGDAIAGTDPTPLGLRAWIPDLNTPEKIEEHRLALEAKLGPLTMEARMARL